MSKINLIFVLGDMCIFALHSSTLYEYELPAGLPWAQSLSQEARGTPRMRCQAGVHPTWGARASITGWSRFAIFSFTSQNNSKKFILSGIWIKFVPSATLFRKNICDWHRWCIIIRKSYIPYKAEEYSDRGECRCHPAEFVPLSTS